MSIRIESSSNEFYKHLKKLHTAKERNKTGRYIAEGTRAVADAIKNNADIYALVVCEGYSHSIDTKDIKVYELSPKLFDDVKLTVNSQGIMAVVNYKLSDAMSLDTNSANTVLYLDSVTDPGNMGTILRSADAMGVDAVVLSQGCVDVFNPKVVRSSMASLLNVPLYTDKNPSEFFEKLRNEAYDIAGTFPRGESYSYEYKYNEKTVLVMGNEANGISDIVEPFCTSKIKIPMLGNTESLNVATACTVMLYEIMLSKIKNNRGE